MNTYHELAEAMRKGAALRPQCYESYFEFSRDHADLVPTASCAVGAMYEGTMGKADGELTPNQILAVFPEVAGKTAYCPVCIEPFTVYTLIVHLNDSHRMAREAIADWLDTL